MRIDEYRTEFMQNMCSTITEYYINYDQTCQPQSGRNRELYFTKSWDFVKNREISETSKVVLLLWIKCIKKWVLYLASRILIVEICLCWTYPFNIGNLGTKFSFMIISLELSAMFLQNKSVKTRVALPTIYGYTYTLIN
jgi:hypothetical protein